MSDEGPWFEETVVLHRRFRFTEDGGTHSKLDVIATTNDPDLVIGLLARAQVTVIDGDLKHDPTLTVER